LLEQHRILSGGISYIELDQFLSGNRAVDTVRSALADFAAAGGVGGWILDLRYNPGGSEATLQAIAGLFVPQGSFLFTRVFRDGTASATQTIGTPVDGQQPLVILTGPYTVSSAEIFAEALRDLGRASIVGSGTAGCVDGGETVAFLDGSGGFISTGHILAGTRTVALEGVGVRPDQSVDLTVDGLASGNDPQVAAAVALLTSQGR
jgi:C-terminal processing protease CtpA/Prc